MSPERRATLDLAEFRAWFYSTHRITIDEAMKSVVKNAATRWQIERAKFPVGRRDNFYDLLDETLGV